MRLAQKFWLWCRSKSALYALGGIALVLLAVRLALPFIIESYVNHQLNRSKEYGGQIGKVTVHLWRGAYQIHDIHIVKKNGQVSVPFYSAGILDLSLEWSELFHGALVSKVAMQRPSLNFLVGPTKEQTQDGADNDWGRMLESLVPFKINRFAISEGQIHFQNPYSTPPVDIYMNKLSVLATNFTNSGRSPQALPAGITARATTLGSGNLGLVVHINPLAKTPTFELTGALTNVDLVSLNDFLKAYGKFDVAHGDFALFTAFAAKDGAYDGYCKVFFNHLKVFNWDQDKHKDALEIFWKAIVGTLTTAFKNQSHDQLATRIPITGTLGKTDVHYWATIGTLLRNAFIKSLVPRADEPVKIEKVEKTP